MLTAHMQANCHAIGANLDYCITITSTLWSLKPVDVAHRVARLCQIWQKSLFFQKFVNFFDNILMLKFCHFWNTNFQYWQKIHIIYQMNSKTAERKCSSTSMVLNLLQMHQLMYFNTIIAWKIAAVIAVLHFINYQFYCVFILKLTCCYCVSNLNMLKFVCI